MPLQFFALDEEFAAATGRNVYVGPDCSRFDNPPSVLTDLVITRNEGDTDPRLFEIGDPYDLSWAGVGGNRKIENAAVMRTDEAPGGGGIIVFEGVDSNGELTHIIWTPDFNLKKWYQDNLNPSAEPNFWVTDGNASHRHGFVCFEASTRLATAMGPVRASKLWVGDHLNTYGDTPQRIIWMGQSTVRGHGKNAPVLFTPGAIGNTQPLRLSQHHRVLISSPQAELLFGAREVLVPAKALVNGKNIRYAPFAQVSYVHILLERHAIVSAEGALCESILPEAETLKEIRLPREADGAGYQAVRPMLSYVESLMLLGGESPIVQGEVCPL